MPRRDRKQNPVSDDSLQQSCPLCRLPDNYDMLSCDNCERWFHINCVGVNEDVANHDWSCQECIAAIVPAPQPPHPTTPIGEPLPHPQSSIPPQPVPRLPTPHSPNPLPPIPRPRTPRIPTVQLGVLPVSSQDAVDPNLINKLPDELQVQLLEEEAAIERKYLLRRYQLLLESSGNISPVDKNNGNRSDPALTDARDRPVCHSSPMNDYGDNIPLFAPPMVHQDRNEPTFIPRLREQQMFVPVDIPPLINNHPNFSTIDPPRANQRSNIPAFNPSAYQRPNPSTYAPPRTDQRPHIPSFSLSNHHRPCLKRPNTSTFIPYGVLPRPTAQEYYPYDNHDFPSAIGGTALLNRSQIAARQAVSKELPIFSGDPEEWPLFFATYENTTNICGFSPEENMARLQKCLRGKALEAVKCQLLHSTNLEQVLSTLRMLFGRPEIIVHSLLQKINALPAPKADHLGTLVDFALAVRNMVATVKACELEEHLCNLTLMYNLVNRLPPMIRLNWATHRQSLRSVTLSEFSDWLYKLAEAVSTVTMPQFTGPSDSKNRRGQKNDGFLNAHTGSDSESEQNDSVNECVICNESCTAVEKCERFVSMDLSARWAALREHKLCRCCLEDHRGPCRFWKSCGKNSCQYKHHRLMHNDTKDTLVTSPSSGVKDHAQASQQAVASSSHDTKSCNTHRGGSKAVLFQYVPVILYNNGIKLRTHAFLDSGSSLTLMEESLAKELNLSGENHPLCLRWTADTCRFENEAMRVSLNVSGTQDGCCQNNLTDVYTVKELKLPSQSLSIGKLSEKYSHLYGLPIESYNIVQPRILIGINNARLLHALDSREGEPNEPVAVKTRLGWTIYGTCSLDEDSVSNMPYNYHISFHSYESDETFPETSRNSVTLDSLEISPVHNKALSQNDERALVKQSDFVNFKNGFYPVAQTAFDSATSLEGVSGVSSTMQVVKFFAIDLPNSALFISNERRAFREGKLLEAKDVMEWSTNPNVFDDDAKWKYKLDFKSTSIDEPPILCNSKGELAKFSLNDPETVEDIDTCIHSRSGRFGSVDENSRYRNVLPRGHTVSAPIVCDVHLAYDQQYHENSVNEVRKGFQIPRDRTICDCPHWDRQLCKLLRAASAPPTMNPILKAQLASFKRPFLYVGVYFRQFLIVVGYQHEKNWGFIVICHTSQATSLIMRSCILTLRLARRGTSVVIISNRGRYFGGAVKKMLAQRPSDVSEDLRRWTISIGGCPDYRGNVQETCNQASCMGRRCKWKWVEPGFNHWGGLLRTPFVRRRTYLLASLMQQRVTGTLRRRVKQAAVHNGQTKLSINPSLSSEKKV